MPILRRRIRLNNLSRTGGHGPFGEVKPLEKVIEPELGTERAERAIFERKS